MAPTSASRHGVGHSCLSRLCDWTFPVTSSWSKLTWWALFVCVSLLTWTAYKTLWASEFYWVYLSCLGVLSICLGLMVLRKAEWGLLSVIGVVGGLLLGQWWFVQVVILRLFWQIGGFAP